MSLTEWLQNGWVVEHQSSRQEIQDLLGLADRDLLDCRAKELSADWRLAIAYNSALQSATAALAASGFRASRDSHHYRVIQSLTYTVSADPLLVRLFDVFRKKRNKSGYEVVGSISELEADEMFYLALELRQLVEKWMSKNHPGLLEKA